MNNNKTGIISIELTDLYLYELGKLRKTAISVVVSVCLSVRQSVCKGKPARNGRIFMKFYKRVLLGKVSTKFNFR